MTHQAIYADISTMIGETRMVDVSGLLPADCSSQVCIKMEGDNPAGSVKDRPARNMLLQAAKRGEIKPGDRLIEATSGNTGIALAMVAASMGYKMTLIMPAHMSEERRVAMSVYGAEILIVTKEQGMEYARDLALEMQARGEGFVLDQFANKDNFMAHELTTGPEIWRDTAHAVTHFVSAMGTTGTITGVSRYLKSQNPAVQIIGAQPGENSEIPGIRRWAPEYVPSIKSYAHIDATRDVTQTAAENMTRRLARELGIFLGISSGGALHIALEVAKENNNACVVSIGCDRGDRYISTNVFNH